MSHIPAATQVSGLRTSLRLSLIFAGACMGFVLSLSAAAQKADDPKSTKTQPDQPQKQKPIQEQEESTKPKIKKKVTVGDDDLDTRRQKSGQVGSDKPGDLLNLAKEAKLPIKNLYQSLAVPRDVVIRKVGGSLIVDPVAPYVGKTPDTDKALQVQPYDDNGNRLPKEKLQTKDVSVQHYEERALRQVENFLGNKNLPRLDMLLAAEQALATVLRYHIRARESNVREGEAWSDVEKRLRAKLQTVELDLLVEYANANNWDAGLEVAERLAKSSKDQDLRAMASGQLARIIAPLLKEGKYGQVQQRKKALEKLFPGSPVVIPINKDLRDRAQALMDQAKGEKDPTEALRLLREAKEIDPQLPGLRDLILKKTNAYPILRVGVPELAENLKNLNLSPATAFSDTEKQAVELIFDSLVKPAGDPAADQRYLPGLAVGRPKIIPKGRQFHLPPEARWSDDKEVTAEDVIRTVELLRDRNWEGYLPEWAELLDSPTPGSDPKVVNLTLRQGFLDPLALMTFKVLPAGSHQFDKPTDAKFARNPVGSGPFVFAKSEGGEAIFLANPHYRVPGQPNIREIHFFHSDNPVSDFKAGRLQLLLDLPTEQIQALKSLKNVQVLTLPNRRIYFLAVNHRLSGKLQNEHVRRAIAHAINRKKILDDVFRADFKNEPNAPHRPLNGPYPPGSWACKPGPYPPPDPFNLLLAQGQANELKKEFIRVNLSLKYPKGDRRVEQACKMIKEQVAELNAGIQLTLEALPARQFHDEVELNHTYDLAYYHYDYPSEAYWAWPLFDPSERAMDRGGPNFLGYKSRDSELASKFIAAMGFRQFGEVERLTHEIHSLLYESMPMIPLWQLDTHIAVHEDLIAVHVDPLLIFSAVEEWKLEKK